MNPPHSTSLMFQMFQFQLKNSYGSYNKTPKISQTQKPNYLQFYCHSSDSISTISTQTPFAASYLMNTFGFTSESALRASKYLRLKSRQQPESVITLLTKYGFSRADISKLVESDPKVLGYSVGRISSKIEFLTSRGASYPDVVKILVGNPMILYRSLQNRVIPAYGFIKDVVHSDEKALAVLKRAWHLLSDYADASVSINFLRYIGVPESNVAYVLLREPAVLAISVRLKRTVQELKVMGFDPSKKNFVTALIVKCGQSKSIWRKKINVYKRWGWTEEEIFEIFKKSPRCMACSAKNISATMKFFVKKLGWGPSVIRGCTPVLGMSLEKRIIPRDSVIQSLLSRGTIEKKSYNTLVFMLTEDGFLDKYVRCYEFADELLKLYLKKRDKSQLKGGSESVQRL
ncbi:hypothetical protein Tsubulata_011707 [Turnera subulata]|uniref:Uncharacterized protein n=1 Tax=Turnera subulata TaxID=218843 RepID=A0A9Q0GA63_9ROSI|nr:hypothetical protein Tsubulata_011707 [Turnera subulata]